MSPTELTFTSENWDTPQTVTVTGEDDADMDGDILYTILTAPAEGDLDYSGLDANDVSVTNIDDDSPNEPTMVSVSSVLYSTQGGGGSRDLVVTVSLENDFGTPVEGASVSIEVSSEPDFLESKTGTTDPGGSATFIFKLAPYGTYTTTVTDVLAAGLVWDGITPPNSHTK